MLEDNTKFLRKSLSGETRLGPHGLYPQVSGHVNQNTIDQQLSALPGLTGLVMEPRI